MRRPAIAGLAGVGIAVFGALLARPIGTVVVLIGVVVFTMALHRTWSKANTVQKHRDGLLREASRLEARQRHDHVLHRFLLDVLDVGIVALREGEVVYANARARSYLGTRVGDALSPLPGAVKAVLAEADLNEGRAQQHYETGAPVRLIEAVAERLVEPGVVALWLTDVTERHRIELMRRDFVAAASHELKTPAAAIRAAAETALMALDDDPDAVRDFTTRVYDNAKRMAQIVSDLLDLSRLEADESPFEALDLALIVEEEIERQSSAPQKMSIDVRPTPMWGNPGDLGLAIRNLLDNAVRYTPDTGHIDVRVVDDDDWASVEVVDDGSGIPANALPRLFERFFRVDDGRSRATGGTGLGLAIVRHVAEQHGGSVAVESEVGAGSMFTMTLARRQSLSNAESTQGDIAPN